MKKYLLIISAFILLSCNKKEIVNPQQEEQQSVQLKLSDQDTVRVIIYWGQSNCKGITPVSYLTNITNPDINDTIPYSYVWNKTTYTIDKYHKNIAGGETSASYGAQLRMMYELGKRDKKYRCLLMWGAAGSQISTTVGDDWSVTSPTSEYFYKFKVHAYRLRKKLQADGHVVIFEKMISYIGETDSKDQTNASNYLTNINAINAGMKSYLGASAANMEFITIRIHDVDTYSNVVRTSQSQVGTMVDTDKWKPTSLHLGAGSYDSLGRELANIIY